MRLDGGERWELLVGEGRSVLRSLPERSVQCVVTSPPYFSLRSYGTPPAVWGGRGDCEHAWVLESVVAEATSSGAHWQSVEGGATGGNRFVKESDPRGAVEAERVFVSREVGSCSRCGAWRGELGLEATVESYVDHLVEFFREVRRVLRDDGTLWVNLGDSYAGGGGISGVPEDWVSLSTRNREKHSAGHEDAKRDLGRLGVKRKDLLMVPAQVALALRRDGWFLRAENVWEKPAPMPESVTDRTTRAHEMVYLFSKREDYFYDADAIREPLAAGSVKHMSQRSFDEREGGEKDYGKSGVNMNRSARRALENLKRKNEASGGAVSSAEVGGRNARSVQRFANEPFSGAHFATFPTSLPEWCLRAGSSTFGACGDCGAPWVRVRAVRRAPAVKAGASAMWGQGSNRENPSGRSNREGRVFEDVVERRTLGWRPSCECHGVLVRDAWVEPCGVSHVEGEACGGHSFVETRYESALPLEKHPVRPCVVLDPFSGAGSTVIAAVRNGRFGIGVDVKREYAELASQRIRADVPAASSRSLNGFGLEMG